MRVLAALAVLIISGAAHAQAERSVPWIDAEAACKKATRSPEGYGYCIRKEQAAYETLRIAWPRLNPASADQCAVAAERQPTPYSWLLACFEGQFVRQEQTRDRTSPPRFQH